jgi:flagellar assembly protein FliH
MSQHQLSISTPFRDARMKRPPAPGGPASEAVERAAYERGRQDAEKSMREQLLTQRSELSAIQRGLFESLRKAVTEVVAQSESLLVELSIEVAGKLVADIPLSPGSVASTVREALTQVEGTTEITVQLHPDDLALLEQVGDAERPSLPGVDAVRLVAAPHVSRGGCLVQTRFGVIDNQRETKLRNLRETLSS